MTITTLNPIADTSVYIGSGGNDNYGNVAYVYFQDYLGAFVYKVLQRFDFSTIAAGDTCLSATLSLFVFSSPTGDADVTLYKISDANGDWIEGGGTELEGEPAWIAKELDGAGGVKTAWAGSAGLSTAGTDYIDTALASGTIVGSAAQNSEVIITFNASGLTVLESLFGAASNNGFLLTSPYSSANAKIMYSRDTGTAEYRPLLTITHEASAGGTKKFLFRK